MNDISARIGKLISRQERENVRHNCQDFRYNMSWSNTVIRLLDVIDQLEKEKGSL